jgi:phage host-nuclease inhibitor protein Gam
MATGPLRPLARREVNMAKKDKKIVPIILADWIEVDQKLRRMGEIDISLEKIEGDMTLQINEIREQYEEEIETRKAERQNLEEGITSFAEDHKEEFAKTRSKDLTFGLIAYRVVKSIYIRSKEATVAAMKALKLGQYIRVVEEPNKESMADLDDNQLAKVGAKRKVEDKFRIEPNIERIKEAA